MHTLILVCLWTSKQVLTKSLQRGQTPCHNFKTCYLMLPIAEPQFCVILRIFEIGHLSKENIRLGKKSIDATSFCTIFTDPVRSTREGNIFRVFVHGGKGVW